MAFSSFHDFISMGGYAMYVWPAFSLVILVLLINVIVPMRLQRKLRGRNETKV